MVRVTIYDSFFKKELTGEFASVDEAKEFYALELDDDPRKIKVIKVEEVA